MSALTMVQAINLALKHEMEKDNRIIILGEDVGRNGGVFRVTDGLLEKFGAERVVDTPLAESAITGTAIGMAVAGLRPIIEIQFDGFLPPAFDQLMSHAARIRTRSRGRYNVPLVVRVPHGGGIRALEHHSDSPEAHLVHTPGLKVVIPSGPYDAKGLLISAIRDPDPIIFFEPKRIYRSIREEVPEEDYTIPIGQSNIVKEGKDITIITYGAMVITALEAAEKLKDKASIEIVDLRTLSPLDEETILASVKKTGAAIILHEAPRTCGLGAEIAAIISEKALLSIRAPIMRVTGWDTIIPLPKLEKSYFPDVHRISKAVDEIMKNKV